MLEAGRGYARQVAPIACAPRLFPDLGCGRKRLSSCGNALRRPDPAHTAADGVLRLSASELTVEQARHHKRVSGGQFTNVVFADVGRGPPLLPGDAVDKRQPLAELLLTLRPVGQ